MAFARARHLNRPADRAGTAAGYRCYVERHLLPVFEDCLVEEIDGARCLRFKARLIATPASLARAIAAGCDPRDEPGCCLTLTETMLSPDVEIAVELVRRTEIDSWGWLTADLMCPAPRIHEWKAERTEDLVACLAPYADVQPSMVQAAVANFAR